MGEDKLGITRKNNQPNRANSAEILQNQQRQKALDDMIRAQHEFEQWRVQETERLQYHKQKLRTQKRQIEQERMELDLEKRHFHHQQEFQETRQKNEEHLLDMKREILERELYKLAEDRKRFEQKKSLYEKVDARQKEDIRKRPANVYGAMFFAGIDSRSALKKRYKDLLKIYHPDNQCGDTDTIAAINQEYQRLMNQMKT